MPVRRGRARTVCGLKLLVYAALSTSLIYLVLYSSACSQRTCPHCIIIGGLSRDACTHTYTQAKAQTQAQTQTQTQTQTQAQAQAQAQTQSALSY